MLNLGAVAADVCRHSFFVLRSPLVHTIPDVSDVSFSGGETVYLPISSVKILIWQILKPIFGERWKRFCGIVSWLLYAVSRTGRGSVGMGSNKRLWLSFRTSIVSFC